MNSKILFITRAAIIAALYVVLSWVTGIFGLASDVIQIRISEALIMLVAFTPAAIPGLTIGCLLFNILSACIIQDIIFGSLATLIGAVGGYLIVKFSHSIATPFLLPIPTILANAIIVPMYLPLYGATEAYWFMFLTVGAGELISCGVIGQILYRVLLSFKNKLFG